MEVIRATKIAPEFSAPKVQHCALLEPADPKDLVEIGSRRQSMEYNGMDYSCEQQPVYRPRTLEERTVEALERQAAALEKLARASGR